MNAQLDIPSTALTLAERVTQALAIQKTESELKALAAKTLDITSVTNPDGRRQVHAAAMALADERIAITKAGKAARDDANAFSKAVIAEEKRLIGHIQPEETRLLVLRDTYDAEQERIRREKAEAEQRRVAAIQTSIASIRNEPAEAVMESAFAIDQRIKALDEMDIDDAYAEFQLDAANAKAGALAKLVNMRDAKAAAEKAAEDVRLAREEEARLAATRRAQEEAERKAAEHKRHCEHFIWEVRHVATEAAGKSSADIERLIQRAERFNCDGAEDHREEILTAKAETLEKLRAALALQQEVEAFRAQREAAEQQRLAAIAPTEEEPPVAGTRYNGEPVTQEMAEVPAQVTAGRVFYPGAEEILALVMRTYEVGRITASTWIREAADDMNEEPF